MPIITNKTKPKVIPITLFETQVLKDYTEKISTRLYCKSCNNKQVTSDINKVIVLLNYCFLSRNNFYISNFNKYYIKDISKFYHDLKSNILTDNVMFTSFIEFVNLEDKSTNIYRLIKFIFKAYLLQYDELIENKDLITEHITDTDITRILTYF